MNIIHKVFIISVDSKAYNQGGYRLGTRWYLALFLCFHSVWPPQFQNLSMHNAVRV